MPRTAYLSTHRDPPDLPVEPDEGPATPPDEPVDPADPLAPPH